MVLDFQTYKDKVLGCWAGKNIGGVLGAPFEGKRCMPDISFYQQDLSMGPPPNDDLDLQIVWLTAAEKYGRNVDASILGEYWLSYVIPNWVEYGTGKANLRAGLVPPMSGDVDNTYKNSCGCFIRSEIWACLMPGHPEMAARYAYEDAIVDHAGEGMYGEIFFAALQSAAFVESDPMKLIDIGLSYIPEDSAIARAIHMAIECHQQKVPFKEARKRVHNVAPGTFGIQGIRLSEIPKENNEGMEIGEAGFDAPDNVAFSFLGWLYGGDDFGKGLCLAVACGEDTDCSCATLGATLGIIMGAKNLPEKWVKPLDDRIVTMCINKTSGIVWIPNTATELTDRVMRVAPQFLGLQYCDILAEGGMQITTHEGEKLYCEKESEYLPLINGGGKPAELSVRELTALSPFVIRKRFTAFNVAIDLGEDCFFQSNESRQFTVTVTNNRTMHEQLWAKIQLYLPDGVTCEGGQEVMLPLNDLWQSKAQATFTVNPEFFIGGKLEMLVSVSLEGRHSYGVTKIVLMRRA